MERERNREKWGLAGMRPKTYKTGTKIQVYRNRKEKSRRVQHLVVDCLYRLQKKERYPP